MVTGGVGAGARPEPGFAPRGRDLTGSVGALRDAAEAGPGGAGGSFTAGRGGPRPDAALAGRDQRGVVDPGGGPDGATDRRDPLFCRTGRPGRLPDRPVSPGPRGGPTPAGAGPEH